MSYGYSYGTYGSGWGFGSGYYSTAGQISAIRGQHAVSQTSNSIAVSDSEKNAAIKAKILNFAEYLERGYEDKAMECYDELQGVLGKYSEYSEADRDYIAELMEATISQEKGEDIDLAEFIRKNAASAEQKDMQEFQLNYGRVFTDRTRIDNNTSESMLNTILGKKENTNFNPAGNIVKKVGEGIGVPVAGAAAGLGIAAAAVKGATIGSTAGIVGMVIGAVAAAGIALLARAIFAPPEK